MSAPNVISCRVLEALRFRRGTINDITRRTGLTREQVRNAVHRLAATRQAHKGEVKREFVNGVASGVWIWGAQIETPVQIYRPAGTWERRPAALLRAREQEISA